MQNGSWSHWKDKPCDQRSQALSFTISGPQPLERGLRRLETEFSHVANNSIIAPAWWSSSKNHGHWSSVELHSWWRQWCAMGWHALGPQTEDNKCWIWDTLRFHSICLYIWMFIIIVLFLYSLSCSHELLKLRGSSRFVACCSVVWVV